MNLDMLTNYIKPELIVVVVILYAIGITLKRSVYIKDELIPYILGIFSIMVCAIYILSVSDTPTNYHQILGLIFDIVIQGICCAAAAVYCNQLYKQAKKLKINEEK